VSTSTTTIDPRRVPLVPVTWAGLTRSVHEGIAAQFRHVVRQWEERGGQSAYRIYSWWGYAQRPNNAGGHPRGIAVDVNPADNPMVAKRTPCPSDMPQWFIQLWKAQGFGWGGDWRSKCDAMHFSKLPNEGGNGRIYEAPRGGLVAAASVPPPSPRRLDDMQIFIHMGAAYVAHGRWRETDGLAGHWFDAYRDAGWPIIGTWGKPHPLFDLPARRVA
jgi:hypothetical protein